MSPDAVRHHVAGKLLPTPEGPGPHEWDLGAGFDRFKTPSDHANQKNADPGDREVRLSVIIARDGPVTIVTIDRRARRNAVDPATAIALREAFAAFADDGDARVAILTGSAGHFCAGFDLNSVGASRYDPDGPGPMGPTRMLLNKPVIAAIEGPAIVHEQRPAKRISPMGFRSRRRVNTRSPCRGYPLARRRRGGRQTVHRRRRPRRRFLDLTPRSGVKMR